MEYTLGEESDAPGQRALPLEELSKQLEKLLQEGSSNQRVFDWIEVCFSSAGGGLEERCFWARVGGGRNDDLGFCFSCTGQSE